MVRMWEKSSHTLFINRLHENKVTSEDLIEFCKKRVAAYKYPRIVEIVPEIPKTATGKFLRRALQQREEDKIKIS